MKNIQRSEPGLMFRTSYPAHSP